MSDDMNDAPAPLCGFSSDEIRSLLRRIGDQIWHPIDFTLGLRIPPRAGFDLANALLAQGYVAGVAGCRADKGRLPGVELTPLGRRLTRERRLQPIPRRQAAAIIAKVTARIADVNGRPGFIHRIVEAHVIGSWCWAEEEVTVVDIGIRLAPRPERARQMKRDLAAQHDAVARLARRWTVLDVAEILRLVRGHTPHLRVYDYHDASQVGPWRERIYPPAAEEGDGPSVSSTQQARARRRIGRSKRRRVSGTKHKQRW
ncbi:hypothetical protein [Rhodoplanes sp. SY1]|uniref:hypothetical protein n=1 Tax=Rhodoplanes sp. SY1 TaxID=3166646 RepID=UPI0038B64EE3